jgi:glycosyltransferase involved in cell wall biosynthesis
MTLAPCSVSVIIPCYNGARYLGEALNSVLVQTQPADEIIVVDDGSTDHSQAIVVEYARKYPQIKTVSQANQGVAAARQTGLKLSQSDYVIFFDQDDRLLPEAIQIGIACFQQRPDCGFVTGHCRLIDSNGDPKPSEIRQIEAINYLTLIKGDCIPTPAPVMFRRTALEAIGGFNLSLAQACDDYDLYLRLTQRFSAYCHNQVVAAYRLHGNNQSSTAGSSRFMFTVGQIFAEQWAFVKGKPEYEQAYREGLQHWRQVYGPYLPYEIVTALKRGQFGKAANILGLALKHYPQGLPKYGMELLTKATALKRSSATQS